MIFISYRIADSNDLVAGLERDLTAEFGSTLVFRDKSGLQGGDRFSEVIEQHVRDCRVMLVVIGSTWDSVKFDTGKYKNSLRLTDKEDWVRREITLALNEAKRVIPVLLNDAKIPEKEWLANFELQELFECQAVRLRANDYAHDLEKLIALLREKCHDPGEVDRLLSAYHAHIRHNWQRCWAESDASDKPPFIETQEVRLLLETEQPERFLHPTYFRAGRAAQSGAHEQGGWVSIDRCKLARNSVTADDGSPCDLSRLVITTDAGIGKTTTMHWLENELSQPGSKLAAFCVTFSELPVQADELLPYLARRLLLAEGRASDGPAFKTGIRVLEVLRREGRFVILLDALDQEPADGTAAVVVRDVLDDSAWRLCRIIISGRPFALQRHWSQLFAPETGRGWRFSQVDEFSTEQQRRFLGVGAGGKSRLDLVPEEARQILSTPRVLAYLRKLPDAELSEMRTAGDVYWRSVEHLLVEGLRGSEPARRIGLNATEPTPARVQARLKQRALKLLAAIAFEMTSTAVSRVASAPGEPSTGPNFDGVRRNRFEKFREALLARLSPKSDMEVAGRLLDGDLNGLAALNEFVEQGLFDTAVEGMQELFWRNRSMQEFFTACWLARHATASDVSVLWDWLYLPDRPETEEYYWIWRFVCEIPAEGLDPDSWLRSIEPVYRPGDGSAAGTRRSCEFIYRAWGPLCDLIDDGEQEARRVRDRFEGEFEAEILSAQRGGATRQLAEQFCGNLITVAAGAFRMGAPPEKQGMVETLRARWKLLLEQEGDPEERARQKVASWNFTPGKRGEHERKHWFRYFTDIFRDRDLDRLERDMISRNETPVEPVQDVEAFQLARCATLNGWYRLFVPGHGEVESSWDSPVIHVSWYDAWAFCQWARWDSKSCRLPREHEWEYAAKAGTPWDWNYWWGDEFDSTKCNAEMSVGNVMPPSPAHANPWGFVDILGNVAQWCEDAYQPSYDRRIAVAGASSRVVRGGSWGLGAWGCRSAFRSSFGLAFRSDFLGFRVARSLDEPSQ